MAATYLAKERKIEVKAATQKQQKGSSLLLQMLNLGKSREKMTCMELDIEELRVRVSLDQEQLSKHCMGCLERWVWLGWGLSLSSRDVGVVYRQLDKQRQRRQDRWRDRQLGLALILLQAFGIGALEDDDAEEDNVYGVEALTSYDSTLAAEGDISMERKFGWTGGLQAGELSAEDFGIFTAEC